MTTESSTPAADEKATPAADAAKTEATATELFPASETPEKVEVAPVVVEKTSEQKAAEDIAAKEAEHAAWFYADGVPGKGKAPDWYLADKFKTAEEQAKAYPHLQSRFGAFTGAPKDGKYIFESPEGLPVTLDDAHPLVGEFQKWAGENQLNQNGYQHLMTMLAQYEAAQVPTIDQIKADIGEGADKRIVNINQWARANLDGEAYNLLREATQATNAAVVFKLVEAVAAKTSQALIPKPGQDVMDAAPKGTEAIQAMMTKKDANGKFMYFEDANYRAQVEAEIQRKAKAA